MKYDEEQGEGRIINRNDIIWIWGKRPSIVIDDDVDPE